MNREKIILEYDRNSGQLYDVYGNPASMWCGLQGFDHEKEIVNKGASPADEVLKLKAANFTYAQIKEMKQNGII